jgi:glucose/arabinose dehydrogenase
MAGTSIRVFNHSARMVNGDKARGRPVGLAVDGQGGVLIADDTGNSVWRVSSALP